MNILGRETTSKGFQLHMYNDISVEKKYIIKIPSFVDAFSVAHPIGPISNRLLKDLHNFHILYKKHKTIKNYLI